MAGREARRSASISIPVEQRSWLIVPLYNEAAVVGTVVKDARSVFPNIVCVDDGSTDGSAGEAAAAGAFVVRHPINLGQGAAIQTGLDYALGDPCADYFVTFDSDGQHLIGDAQSMVVRLESEPLDIVFGSRFLDSRTHIGFLKRLVLKFAVFFERASTGVRLTDAHNGLRAMNREAAGSIRITQNRMAHASEIVAQAGRARLRYSEQAVHVVYTEYSRSKGQSMWNSVNILNDLFFK